MARESRFFLHNSLPSRLDDYHVRVPIILHVCENQSVWKGICETRDFAKYCVGFKKTQNILTGYGIRDTGFHCYHGIGICQNFATGCTIFFSVCREFVKSSGFKRSSGKCESTRSARQALLRCGFKTTRPGARFSKVPIINGPGKLSPFTLKIDVSIVLQLA